MPTKSKTAQRRSAVNGGPFYRDMALREEDSKGDEHGVRLAFSSEAPVERWLPDIGRGLEILDHSPRSVRLGRLNGGAAVLLNHDPDQYAGRVEEGSATLGNDRIGRVAVLYADTEEGQRLARNVPRGFYKHSSFGYRVHKVRVEKQEGNKLPIFRAVDWEPFEVSFATVPADQSVGVGRSDEASQPNTIEVINMPRKKRDNQNDDDIDLDFEDDDETGDETVTEGTRSAEIRAGSQDDSGSTQLEELNSTRGRLEERNRVRGIHQLADRYRDIPGVSEMVRKMIADGAPVSKFEEFIAPKVREYIDHLAHQTPSHNLGMGSREAKNYSFVRALRALHAIHYQEGKPDKIAPFEMRVSREVAERLDTEPRGLYVPHDVLDQSAWPIMRDSPRVMYRDAPMGVATTNTVAAALVGTAHLAGSFIEALRPSTIVMAAGAQVLPGLDQNVSIPKQTGRGSWGWIAEDADAAETEVAIGSVTLSPKTIAGRVPITRRLMKQATPAVEQIVRGDIILGIAEAIDDAALEGTGLSGQPEGLVNITGVLTQAVVDAGMAPTWAEALGFVTTVAAQNALRPGAAYVTTPALWGTMQATPKVASSGGAGFVMENGQVGQYPVLMGTQLTAATLIFGAFSQMLVGMWGVLDLLVDVYSESTKGRTVLKVFQDVDVNVRHPQAFCIGT